MKYKLDPNEKVCALLSGGKDSVVCSHLCKKKGILKTCIYTKTGTEPEGFSDAIEDICKKQDFPLIILKPKPHAFEKYVLTNGFPHVPVHWQIMRELKIKPWEKFERDERNNY